MALMTDSELFVKQNDSTFSCR